MLEKGHRAGCTRSDHPHVGRRGCWRPAACRCLGWGWPICWLEGAHRPAAPRGTAKSVVFIFQSGGPSQHETWDPKPNAPAEIRGEYGTTSTAVNGVHFCEYLPRLAARADRFSIVRTMHHPAAPQFRNEHNAAMYMVQTGRCELPPGETTTTIQLRRPRRFEWPSIGSAVAYAMPDGSASGLPPVVEIPRSGGQMPGSARGCWVSSMSAWRVDLAARFVEPRMAAARAPIASLTISRSTWPAPGKQPGDGGTTAVAATRIFICPTWVCPPD